MDRTGAWPGVGLIVAALFAVVGPARPALAMGCHAPERPVVPLGWDVPEAPSGPIDLGRAPCSSRLPAPVVAPIVAPIDRALPVAEIVVALPCLMGRREANEPRATPHHSGRPPDRPPR